MGREWRQYIFLGLLKICLVSTVDYTAEEEGIVIPFLNAMEGAWCPDWDWESWKANAGKVFSSANPQNPLYSILQDKSILAYSTQESLQCESEVVIWPPDMISETR